MVLVVHVLFVCYLCLFLAAVVRSNLLTRSFVMKQCVLKSFQSEGPSLLFVNAQ